MTSSALLPARRRIVGLLLVVTALVFGSSAAPAGAAVPTAYSLTGPSTLVWSQQGTFSAKVATKKGQPRATGVVTFSVPGLDDAVVPLGGTGVAAWKVRTLPVGTHEVSASYGGDAIYPASAFPPVSVTVGPASTTTTVTSTKPVVAAGGTAGFDARTAKVAPATGSLAGTTRFTLTAYAQSPIVVDRPTSSSGRATLVQVLPEGRWTVTAEYLGSDQWVGSTSAGLLQVVGDPQPVPDQEVSTVSGESATTVYNYPGYRRLVAQSFTAGITGSLTAVGLVVEMNTGDGPVEGSIQTIVGGVPSGTELATFTAAQGPRGSALQRAELDTPLDVVAGTEYAIVLGTGVEDDYAALWGWANGDGLSYERGDGFVKDGTNAYAAAGHDFRFSTEVLPG